MPGHPEESPLIDAIQHDAAIRMPPQVEAPAKVYGQQLLNDAEQLWQDRMRLAWLFTERGWSIKSPHRRLMLCKLLLGQY